MLRVLRPQFFSCGKVYTKRSNERGRDRSHLFWRPERRSPPPWARVNQMSDTSPYRSSALMASSQLGANHARSGQRLEQGSATLKDELHGELDDAIIAL